MERHALLRALHPRVTSRRTSRPSSSHLVLATVVFFATLLAATWAITVPIFENPDEVVHADYALTLMSVGHVIRYRDGSRKLEANPLTAYLAARSKVDTIASFPGEGVPDWYLRRSAMRRLDQAAPWRAAAAFAHDERRPNPVLVIVYPPAYYAIAAIVGRVASLGGSLLAAFFAMRLLGVALLVVTLVAGYAALRELDVKPFMALTIATIVGFFPEQTFVAASIQPDNLAEALFAVALLFALRARRTQATRDLVFLTLVIALEYLTKKQYFLAASLACLIAVTPLLFNRRGALVAAFSALALALAVGIDRFVTSIPPTFHDALALPAVAGFLPRIIGGLRDHPLTFIAAEGGSAFHDYLFGGSSFTTYWGVFGWLDAPLSFGSPTIDRAVQLTELFGGTVLWIAGAVVFFRSFGAIIRTGRTGGPVAALAQAGRDPLLLSLAVFTFIMIVLHVGFGEAIGFQGRYWLPLAFPTMYAAIVIAPRIVRHARARVVLSTAVAALLLVYSLVGSVFAMSSVTERYYRPPAPPAPPTSRRLLVDPDARPMVHFDHLGFEQMTRRQGNTFWGRGPFHIDGWLAPNEQPITGTYVIVDGTPRFARVRARPDVGRLSQNLLWTGFSETLSLQPGTHRLRLEALEPDRVTITSVPEEFTLVVYH